MGPQAMIEVWRGGMPESLHRGHAVVADAQGGIVHGWGDPAAMIFPRSSCKMIQALPLIESGAADAAGLTGRHLALACASHSGAHVHTDLVTEWLAHIGMAEPDLRCGSHWPIDIAARDEMIRAGATPCQIHNNCSGKHTGFLTLNRHIGGGSEYVEPDHPVQRACRAALEETTGEASPGYGIDGCSAPNFATSVRGLARAMASFASADARGGARDRAMARLVAAMGAHPELVAGEGRACTDLMRATGGRAAVKTGAEAVFVGIVPGRRLGIALKIEDGGTRAAEAAITALLVRLGVLEAGHPVVAKYLTGPLTNWRGLRTGEIRLAAGFG
ncbi:MAG: asparaginase [Pseudomonadota bacterium]